MNCHCLVSSRARQRRVSHGFTLVELLVVIAIIAILAAILFPVFGRAREQARKSSCTSNFKQIGLGLMQYTQDHDERFPSMYQYTSAPGTGSPETPTSAATNIRLTTWRTNASTPAERYISSTGYTGWHYYTWKDSIFPYTKNLQVYHCPSHNRPVYRERLTGSSRCPTHAMCPALQDPDNPGSYPYWIPSIGINGHVSNYWGSEGGAPGAGAHLAAVNGAAGKIFAMHEATYYDQKEPAYVRTYAYSNATILPTNSIRRDMWPHMDGAPVLFCDGHVKWYSRVSGMKQLTCEGQADWNDVYTDGAGCGYWRMKPKPPVGG